jgi:hypothetical protein
MSSKFKVYWKIFRMLLNIGAGTLLIAFPENIDHIFLILLGISWILEGLTILLSIIGIKEIKIK